MCKRLSRTGAAAGAAILFILLLGLLSERQAEAVTASVYGVSRQDPGFTYGPAARDWVDSANYYYVENDHVKFTVGTVRLSTMSTTDYSPNASGNDKWGSLTKGSMMDAAPKPGMRDNLDYTEFVLREDLHRTWWYPTEKLEMQTIGFEGETAKASGDWDRNDAIKSTVRYSAVENTPLIKMELTLTNQSAAGFSGYLGYFFDSDEAGEQHSYVPGWGWRTAQANQWIESGWNRNYIFNGVKDKFTGRTAHAVIWPQQNQPAALVPEGYIQGVWFEADMAVGESKTLVFYHLPHIAGPADAPYEAAEFWANMIWQGSDPSQAGMIAGIVTDHEGAAIPNAEIRAKDAAGRTVARAVTDGAGFYQLYMLQGSNYTIEAVKSGYWPTARSANLTDTDRAETNLNMIPATMTPELPDAVDAIARISRGEPGFTYAPASRDWVEGKDYYLLENDEVKLTVGTDRLATPHPTDYSDNVSGNNKWGTLTPGHMMDAAPKFNNRENLDYTEFVLSPNVGRTWWYPYEKLSLPNIQVKDRAIVSSGAWDNDPNVKAEVTYSIVENSPLIKMKIKLTNEGAAAFSGNLAYIVDPEETLEQMSYVPGWGWRGGQTSEYITSGWNKNYIFNGIQDKYTGNTAHAIIWPDNQQPSALIPEGYITGAWFEVSLAPNGTKELVIYHLPHNPSSAYESYQTAEFWADAVKNGIDPSTVGKITGTVTDAAGLPSQGVDIVFETQSGGKYAAATTDSRGMYSVYTVTGNVYGLRATNGTELYELTDAAWLAGKHAQADFTMPAPDRETVAGVTRGDPGFIYEGTSRDWWPKNDYYYIESPELKFTVGTVRTAGMDPVNWTNDASGNNKWGTLTPGHMMDAVPKLNGIENMDFTEFVLSDDLGVTPEDEANGKHMEWSWFHPLTKLELPDISLDGRSIVAKGDWDRDERMKSSVRYSIVEGTPLIRMEITLNNQTGADFNGSFGYIVDPDQPGEQHSYVPGRNWVFNQEKEPIKEGWTDNYLFSGISNSFTGKTAHAVIWPQEQQPSMLIHEGVFAGAWFEASIPNNGSKQFVVYHMPHIAGPADKPYAVAEYWAKFIREHGNAEDYGSISGTVKDEAGVPLAFTEVVSKDGSGNVYARAVTTADGRYQIFAEKGVYAVSPVNDAYFAQHLTVEIGDERRVRADFQLQKVADVAVALPSGITAGTPFEFTVTVHNATYEALNQVEVDVQPPYFVRLLGDGKVVIPVVDAMAEAEIKVKAVALEGGRSAIRTRVSNDLFSLTRKTSFDVMGEGFYAGDSHSHTKHSDGVHTIAENSERVYNKRLLSWVWSTEHNKDSHKPDAEAVSQSYDGRFLSLAGTEVTTPVGHALVYGMDSLPRFDIDNSGSGYSWQDSIDDITGQGGLVYIAHPFEQTFLFQNPYQWRGFTGVEVWNGTWHALDNGVNEKAFKFWDEINIRGDAKYYGIANTDAHTRDKVGDTYSKGWMPSLTKANVLELLRTGGFYGTNGPEIRFGIGGIEMGGTLKLEEDGMAPFRIEAYDPNSNLTRVRVIKYPVTGDIADYAQREIVFDEDLTGQGLRSFVQTISLPVADKEFYRLEVFSEKANENSSGIGPLTGTGFAFSNPVWVETADSTNAAAIKGLVYSGGGQVEVSSRFGVDHLTVQAEEFDPEKLIVKVSGGAAVTSKHYVELIVGPPALGMLKLTVTAKDGSSRDYEYLVYTGTDGEDGNGNGNGNGIGNGNGNGNGNGEGNGDGKGYGEGTGNGNGNG